MVDVYAAEGGVRVYCTGMIYIYSNSKLYSNSTFAWSPAFDLTEVNPKPKRKRPL
jgi:hypothetical protein